MMFGYACDETPELMPAPITYAHQLLQHAATLHKNEDITWMRPDSRARSPWSTRVTPPPDGYGGYQPPA